MDRDFGKDVGGSFRAMAQMISRGGPRHVPTVREIAEFMFGVDLKVPPGSIDPKDPAKGYSNSAFGVLTAIIEQAAVPRSYIQFLRDELFAPLGISDVHVGNTAENQRRHNEVPTYDADGFGLSEIDLRDDAMAPAAYGGAFQLETAPGEGGLIMSTGTIARFIADHNVYGLGPRNAGPPFASRDGVLAGTLASAASRPDGIDFALALNRRVPGDDLGPIKQQIDTIIGQRGANSFSYSILSAIAQAVRNIFSLIGLVKP
jgi:CubicO group peptidase (beta-lactamase class C family)